jgi:hypothetical protein
MKFREILTPTSIQIACDTADTAEFSATESGNHEIGCYKYCIGKLAAPRDEWLISAKPRIENKRESSSCINLYEVHTKVRTRTLSNVVFL